MSCCLLLGGAAIWQPLRAQALPSLDAMAVPGGAGIDAIPLSDNVWSQEHPEGFLVGRGARAMLVQREANAVAEKETGLGIRLAGPRVGVDFTLTSRSVGKLFDDPALDESGLRVRDDILRLGLGVELVPHLALGLTYSGVWSEVLGTRGTGSGWRGNLLYYGRKLDLGLSVGTTVASMDWSQDGGGGFNSPDIRSICGAMRWEIPVQPFGATLALAAQYDYIDDPNGAVRVRRGALAVTPLEPITLRAGLEWETGPGSNAVVPSYGIELRAKRLVLLGSLRAGQSPAPGVTYQFGLALLPREHSNGQSE